MEVKYLISLIDHFRVPNFQLHTKGKCHEAEPLYRRALVIWEAAMGPDHPQVATGLNNVATLLEGQVMSGD